MIKVGCCGFARGMKNYIKKFNLVEVQQTFYNPPKLDTLRKWANMTNYFEFTIKAWQLITHPPTSQTYRRAKILIDKEKISSFGFFRPTNEVFSAWEKINEICEILNARIVIFQTPASFLPNNKNIKNIESFFTKINRKNLTLVWEPRGNWEDKTILKICKKLNLVHCVDPFARKTVTKALAYFRLHGSPPGKKMYNYKYTKEDLKKLKKICESYGNVYCLFNNMYMYENALEFMEIANLEK